MLEVKDLRKKFGKQQVLNDVSFKVESGDICALLGVNGAGKTTTFRSIVGLVKADAGEITIHGYSTDDDQCTRRFGYVPDKYYQLEYLSLTEQLVFIANNFGINGKAAFDRAQELIEEFELSNFADIIVSNLSHGLKQRLSLVSALVHKPKLLIIDEPLVGLDPNSAELLINRLKHYAANGTAILFSTHLLHVVEKLSTQVLLLDQGQIVLDKSTSELNQNLESTSKSFLNLFGEIAAQKALW